MLGEGGPGSPPPDRTQLRCGARRPLLPAGLAQGDAVPARGRDAARVLRRSTRSRTTSCGKVLVALDDVEEGRLERHRGEGPGQRRSRRPPVSTRDELREIEPHVRGVGGAALAHDGDRRLPGRDPRARRLTSSARRHGPALGTEMTGIRTDGGRGGADRPARRRARAERFDRWWSCAGLQADRGGRAGPGTSPSPRIVPFRGEYYAAGAPSARTLVRGLVYPVPDPRYPFLGVHMTPRVDGEVDGRPQRRARAGPRGLRLAHRLAARPARDRGATPGFRRFARKHWLTGVARDGRVAEQAPVRRRGPPLRPRAARRRTSCPVPTASGRRTLERDGELVDDFGSPPVAG